MSLVEHLSVFFASSLTNIIVQECTFRFLLSYSTIQNSKIAFLTYKAQDSALYSTLLWLALLDLDARKPVFGSLRTRKAQTSLRIRAV